MTKNSVILRPMTAADATETEAFFDRFTEEDEYFFNPRNCTRLLIRTYFFDTMDHAQALYTKMGYGRIGTHSSGTFLYICRF